MRFNNRCTALTTRNNLLYVSGQSLRPHDSDSTCFKRAVISKPNNYLPVVVAKFTFPLITYFSTIEIGLHLLYRKKAFTRPFSFTRKRRLTSRSAKQRNDLKGSLGDEKVIKISWCLLFTFGN